MRLLAILPPLAVLLSLGATPALAHKMKVFVTAEGSEVVGTVYFSGGDKARDVDGVVLNASGALVGSLRTDGEGGFRYAPPDGNAYRLRFQSGDGHMAEAAIGASSAAQTVRPAAPAAAMAAAPLDSTALETALARQLRPLREQVDALESRTRLSDIVGGIGFIFGLFGCAAWLATRRKEKRP